MKNKIRDKLNVAFYVFFCLLLNGLFTQIAAQTSDTEPVTPFDITPFETQCVARVGDIDIMVQEFILNYEFGPAFLKRTEDSKKRYLDVMIYEKLLALDGYRLGLDSKNSVMRSCAAIEEDLITEELFKEEVMSRVTITDQEIEQSIPLAQQYLYLKWLYSQDEQKITSWHLQLNSGDSFDSLFTVQLNNDSVTTDDRSLETTYFKFRMRNPVLAAIIDTLPFGISSQPISAPDGWYIIMKDNSWINAISTESEIEKLRHELRRSIFKHKLDQASDGYVQELMQENGPVIDKDTFALLVLFLGHSVSDSNIIRIEELKKYLSGDFYEVDFDNIYQHVEQILVQSEAGNIKLGNFLDWYQPRQAYLKFNPTSSKSFILSVQQTIWRMVRDYFLIQRAHEKGLDSRESVQVQKQWWKDKIVFNARKAEIAASITYEELDLLVYYKDNIARYRNSKGDVIPFEKARNNVQSDFIREKYMSQLMRRILQLKQIYSIQIYDDVLAAVKVEDEENPKAIDLYAVKKGGLLPRQPYPTIDWEWQLWY